MAIQPLQMLAVGEFLEKHGASDGLMDTFKAICEELVEGQKPTTNNASDAMRRFDDVDIEALSDHDMAWTARIIVREYRAALARIA